MKYNFIFFYNTPIVVRRMTDRIIKISSTLFLGYTITLSDERFLELGLWSIESLTRFCNTHLIDFFKQYNLSVLAQKAQDAKFHVHSFTLDDWIYHTQNEYYICECDTSDGNTPTVI